jgi:hypothetical protein
VVAVEPLRYQGCAAPIGCMVVGDPTRPGFHSRRIKRWSRGLGPEGAPSRAGEADKEMNL